MKRGMLVIGLFCLCQSVSARRIEIPFSPLSANLYSSINAVMANEQDTSFWKTDNYFAPSEVVYYFDVKHPIAFALAFPNWNYMTQDINSYFILSASRNGVNYVDIYSYALGKTARNFTKDISGGVAGGTQIFVRTRFSGSVRTFNDGANLIVLMAAPEPSSLILGVIFMTLYCLRIRKRIL